MKINITYEATDTLHVEVYDHTTLEKIEWEGISTIRQAIRKTKGWMRMFDKGDQLTAVIWSGTTGEVLVELSA